MDANSGRSSWALKEKSLEPTQELPSLGAKLDGDLMHMEQPTELKDITQWRKSKQLRLLQL
jgi:hypothetical protein